MFQPNQESTSSVPAVGSSKRRRRGNLSLDPDPSQYAQRMQKVVRAVPISFGGPVENAPNNMLGKAVSGVIEGAFDAGYLITARVGNSDTPLKGVIFNPERYVPLSSENDVAPQATMIASKGKQVPTVPTQAARPLAPWSKKVPITFHPFNLSNGIPPTAPAPHLRSSKGKKVPITFHPSNLSSGIPPAAPAPHLGSSKGKQVPIVPTQAARPLAPWSVKVPITFHPSNLSSGIPPAAPAPHLGSSKGKHLTIVRSIEWR